MTTPFDTRPDTEKLAIGASKRSVEYLTDLMLDKAAHLGVVETQARADVERWLADWPSQISVSQNIDRLKREGYTGRRYTFGQETPQVDDMPDVPEGRYALPTLEGADNEIAFYRVDRPTEGRWAGKVFACRLSGGEEIKLGRDGTARLVTKIAQFGPELASALYGQNIGRCGICNITLTNDVSRARGIGPKCAAKHGW